MATRRCLPSVPPRKRARYSNAMIQKTRKGVRGRASNNMGEQTISADAAVLAMRTSSIIPVIDFCLLQGYGARNSLHSEIVYFVPQSEWNGYTIDWDSVYRHFFKMDFALQSSFVT